MANKTVLITQARISSTRLPGKVLKKIGDRTLLEIHLHRILQCQNIDEVIVATTKEDGSDEIVNIAKKMKVKVYIGSLDDVLDRYYQAALSENPNYVVRVTADCPLISPALIDKAVEHLQQNKKLDYCSNNLKKTYPHGLDVEAMTFAALKKAWQEAKLPEEREHVTPYIRNNSSFLNGKLFISENLECAEDLYRFRITVDYAEDFNVVQKLILELGIDVPWEKYIDRMRSQS